MANGPNLNLISSVNKPYSNVGEIITYTLVITNIGDVTTSNVILLNAIPKYATYIGNSFTINGVTQSGITPAPPQGGLIGDIAPGESTTINFQVLINAIPDPNVILNSGIIKFNYVKDLSNPITLSGSIITNQVQTFINNADIDISAFSDKASAKIGDTITYTFLLKNSGNTIANNLFFVDSIPEGTKFLENSLYYNGINQLGINPSPGSGVLLAPLSPNGFAEISFKVTVVSLPPINPISNNGTIYYGFIVNPNDLSMINSSKSSNTVTTFINQANLNLNNTNSLIKKVDKSYATLDDILTYTVNLKNIGNTPANNVLFLDNIPTGTTLVPNSVIINGILRPGENPEKNGGITLGTINPNKSVTLSFKVQVTTIPNPNIISNSSTVYYNYTVDPINLNTEYEYGNTNVVTTTIIDDSITLIQSSNKKLVIDGDIITYLITLKNTGNIILQDLILSNKLHPNTQMIVNSITLNGNSLYGADIEKGFVLPNLHPNTTFVVGFQVKVDSIPNCGFIENKSKLSYAFTLDPSYPLVRKELFSNTTNVDIKGVNFKNGNFRKSSDVNFTALGDIVTYSFYIKNDGNIQANEVILFDNFSEENLFIPNSLIINDVLIPGVDPKLGVSLGCISPGEIINLSFKTQIKSIPKSNPLTNAGTLSYELTACSTSLDTQAKIQSNTVDIFVNSPIITLDKSVFPPAASVGSMVNYKIIANNSGNATATNILIRDLLSPYLEFDETSVMVNGKKSNYNIINGIPLDTLNANASKVITFNAKVLEYPTTGKIKSKASANYYFTQHTDMPKRQQSIFSNENILYVENVQIDLTTKTNMAKALIGTDITHTIFIENNGTVNVTDFIFKTILPEELTMIPNTFTLNGQSINGVNIVSGIRIGTIRVNDSFIITYKTKVDSDICNCKVKNEAYGEYTYKLTDNSPIECGRTNILENIIMVPSPKFKQLSLDQVFTLNPNYPKIAEIDNVTPNIEIVDYHIVKTPIGTSCENQNITGYKLVINGIASNTIEYTGLVCDHSVYTVYFKKEFSTYIILPKTFTYGRNVKLTPVIEHVNPIIVNPRTISVSLIFMINLTIF